MAQAGFTPIQLYFSSTAAAVPTSGNLIAGELALNTNDGKLYYKTSAGLVRTLADAATSTGNLPGGTTGAVVFQSSTGVTAYLPLGTNGYLLTAGATAPQYVNPATFTVGIATTATNVAGGSANRLVYQTAPNVSAFAPAPTTAGLVLGWTGTAFNWVSAPAATSATNLAGGAAFEVPYQTAPNTTAFSPNFQFDGNYLRVGDTVGLVATNPIIASTGNQNLYIQHYVYNANSGSSASADFVAYADNSTNDTGWIDMSLTSSTYADANYTVVGPNEGSITMSAPLGAGKSGNLVYATDSTGTTNAHQWYVGGFTQAKSAYKMQLSATALTLNTPLSVTGSTGTAGFVLASTGSSTAPQWIDTAAIGTTNGKLYFFGQF